MFEYFSGLHSIYQALVATLFTGLITALGSGFVFLFKTIIGVSVANVQVFRLNRISDAVVVQEIFQEMTKKLRQQAYELSSATLHRKELVKNEWAIYLCHPSTRSKRKSGFAENLVGILRSVEFVHYKV